MDSPTAHQNISVLLLAGGRGQRMGGQDKGLLIWRERPLIAWLYALTRPLTDDLIISCNRNYERYSEFADRLVHDDSDAYEGPLAGIRAGLNAARHSHLLVLPCDAPKVDTALINRLLMHAGTRPVVVRRNGFWEPLFSLIPSDCTEHLESAWQAGERSPQRWLRSLNPVAVDCENDDPRLANLNTPQRLD